MKSALSLVGAMLMLAVSLWSQSTDQPQLRILSPSSEDVVIGTTKLQATVTPSAALVSIAFSVDGQQVCTVTTAPFDCEWDAGRTPNTHQVRVVATLQNGARLIQTVRTGADSPALAAPTFAVRVEAVELAVTVSEGKRFVRRLPASAFHVFEDDKPQKIASFVAENSPLNLVVAVDTSLSMTPAMSSLKAAAKTFLAAVPVGDATTVLAFNDEIIQVATPSTSVAERGAAIDRLTAHGATSLNDVIIRSIDLVGHSHGRKAVVVFTDGEDQGSQASFAEVERRLQTTDASLYMIGQGRGLERAALKRVMQQLVQPTGGQAFFTEKIDDLKEVFADLLTELTSQYLITYLPSNTAHDDRWRRIRVSVDGHHDVRTREGYRLALTH